MKNIQLRINRRYIFNTRTLRFLMSEHKLSNRDLSEAIQVARSAINNWLNRGTQPSSDCLLRLATVFSIDPFDLMENVED